MEVVDRWERIDLLHVDIDPHCEDDARRWLAGYAGRCRAIAVPIRTIPGSGSARSSPSWPPRAWQVFEYRGEPVGLDGARPARRAVPDEDARAAEAASLVEAAIGRMRPVVPVGGIRMDAAVDLYLDLMMRCLTDWLYDEFDEPIRAEGLDWPARAHTMIGLKRLANVRACVESVLADGVPGDLIETGAWRGGTTIFMRAILKVHGVADRTVWVADSFAGLPPPDAARYPRDAGDRLHEFPQFAVPLERVRDNFRRYGLLDEQVRFLAGLVPRHAAGGTDRAAGGAPARRRPVRVDDPGPRGPLRPALGRRLRDRGRLRQRGGLPPGGARLPRGARDPGPDPADRLGRSLPGGDPRDRKIRHNNMENCYIHHLHAKTLLLQDEFPCTIASPFPWSSAAPTTRP